MSLENERALNLDYSDIHREIIEQSKAGDRKAHFQLYKLYSKAMYNTALRLMNSREAAEDMLQEAFADAFERLGSFRYESSFGSWLKRIVINRCINELKSRKIELVLLEDYSLSALARQPQEGASARQREAELKLEVKRILEALKELADGYRVVFSLYMLEGYEHNEIAQILGISESTSKSQYLRAKRKLKEILEKKEI